MLILLGVYSAKLPWFGREGMNFLSKFVLDIAIPLYLFYNVTRTYSHPRELLPLLYNLCYPVTITLIGMFIGFLMTRLLGIKPPQRGIFINAVSLSNVVVMGMPVVVSLFGNEVIPAAMVYYTSNTVMYWIVGVWLLRLDVGGGKKMGAWKTIRTVLLSRPLIGFMCGVAWVIFNEPLPAFASRTLGMLSSAVTPLAMIFIGSVIRHSDFRKISHLRELAFIIGYRLFAVPVITAMLCRAFPIDLTMKKVFFILANMPAMAQLPIMAKEVEGDYELASMATAMTTAISMAAVPFYVFALEYFQFLG